jgi:predicted transcriptional regulator
MKAATTLGVSKNMKEDTTNGRDDAAEIIRLLVCSDLRRNLVLTLHNGAASLSDLRQHVGVSSTAAIHALRELERDHVTSQDGRRHYALTNIGKILALKLERLTKAANVLTEHNAFWLEHDLSGIPATHLADVGCLEESYILTSTSTDLFKVYSTFTTLVENAKEIKGISSILIPDMINVFSTLGPKAQPVELIVTSDVFDKMRELVDRQELRRALEEGNLRLFSLKENPKIGLTVTDYFLSLGLFRGDGMYDYSHDLLSYSAQAIEWGTRLFDHYAAASEEVSASEI